MAKAGDKARTTAVELFCGIGGFRVAADRLGIKTIWANDLSERACRVYSDRFGPAAIHQADVADVGATIPAHDLLTAGFPCQPFSSAGKKEGVRDPRGTLFQRIVETLKRHRPKWFVLENVKRLLTMEQGDHFATILSALTTLDYFVEWRLLNAMHLGLPQNRERVFIVGVSMSRSLDRDWSPTRLATATDLATLGEKQDRLFDSEDWTPVSRPGRRFRDWGIAHKGRFFTADGLTFSEATPSVRLSSVLEPTVSDEFDFTTATLEWLNANTPVNRFVNGVEILSNQRGGARMGYTIFGINGVAPTLTSTTSRHYERYKIGERYRRLTNVEYARIQGFADDHCRVASVYDQYALFGNAAPPPMAEWAIQRLRIDGVARGALPLRRRPRGLFDYA